MSSNTNLELVNLDFFTLKNSLKKYLSAQDQFKDYDFEGSNMSVLLDVLAYNTYMNSFYLNMVASEMFLDSAQIRDSIVSHAKELNYLPRSFRSAEATVNITVTPSSSVETVTILKGTSFSSRVGSNTFSFVTNDNIILTSNTSSFIANSVVIYEGEVVSESFVYNTSNTVSQVVLSNQTADTRSIEVYVYEDNGANVLTYTQGTTFLGLTSNSQVFFVQAARNDSYEIVFGNGTQGREPKDGSTILVKYRACNGELPNGAAVFTSDGTIDGHANIVVTTVNVASGGAVHESLQSIKKNAPRFFQTQERAVTVSDYKILLQNQFPEIQSLSVFGGEDADPPQYGRVFISVDLENADGVPNYKKQIYSDYIKTITPLSIDPIIIDPEFMYIMVNSTVKYNINSLQISENSLKSLIENKIQVYNQLNLEKFDSTFRYSNLVSDIDNTDPSIISNETAVTVYKEITPDITIENSYVINFYNALENLFAESIPSPHRSGDYHIVYSTSFVFENQTCRIEDNGVGELNIVALTDTQHTKIKSIGSVDYNSGKVTITKFQPTSYSGIIKIFAVTKDSDVSGTKNNIIKIKPLDISVSMVGVRV